MTRRLLLSYLGLAVVILVALEVPLGLVAAQREHKSATTQARRDASGLAVESEADVTNGNVAGLQLLLNNYRLHTGAEVVIVNASGGVVAQVDPDRNVDTSAKDRRKVDAALRGQTGSMLTSDRGEPAALAAAPIGRSTAPLGAVVLLSPVGAYTDHAVHIWLALGLFGVAVLVLTALVGLWLARSLSRPLAQLGGAVARLGEGQLTSRAPAEHGPPEMRGLAEQFNRMADRLEELIAAQTRFVADASHQLRSPLTALRLRLENLEASLERDAAEPLVAAGREVARLSRLVDGLLTLSRAGGAAPEATAVDIHELVAERCESWAALAAERRVHLICGDRSTRPVSVPLVAGDLEQILDNLLANALDASPVGSTITVTLQPARRDRLEIHVLDEGPGLSDEERARAFDRFWQGPGRHGGHSGLGLAIVRQLAQRNGVSVELAPGPGRGLDAVVHLRSRAERPHDASPDLTPTAPAAGA